MLCTETTIILWKLPLNWKKRKGGRKVISIKSRRLESYHGIFGRSGEVKANSNESIEWEIDIGLNSTIDVQLVNRNKRHRKRESNWIFTRGEDSVSQRLLRWLLDAKGKPVIFRQLCTTLIWIPIAIQAIVLLNAIHSTVFTYSGDNLWMIRNKMRGPKTLESQTSWLKNNVSFRNSLLLAFFIFQYLERIQELC